MCQMCFRTFLVTLSPAQTKRLAGLDVTRHNYNTYSCLDCLCLMVDDYRSEWVAYPMSQAIHNVNPMAIFFVNKEDIDTRVRL